VSWERDSGAVLMRGPAVTVFEGRVEI